MASLFISHSSNDPAATNRVVERLTTEGFAALFLDFDPVDGIPAARDLGVKGSRVQAGEAWDSLSLWLYAIQAVSQEMTARPAGQAVGNAGLCR